MATTTFLGLTKPVDEYDAQKVTTYNEAIDNLDKAIAGTLTLSVAGGADVTLTGPPTGSQSLYKAYELTGLLTANINVKFQSDYSSAQFVVFNNTTGAFTLTVKTTAGGSTGIAVTQGKKRLLWTDGTNVYDSIDDSGLPGGGDALVANPLSQFAATSSAQLRSVISDENGTGVLLFDSATSPTFLTSQTISGAAPSLVLTDTTASAKSLTVAVDGNKVDLRESAGAAGSLLALDLANNRVGIRTATPLKSLHVGAGTSTPSITVDGLYLAEAGDVAFVQRDCTNNIEFFVAIANSTLAGVLMGTVTNHPVAIRTNATERMRVTAEGNIKIAGTASRSGTTGVGHLDIFNGTDPAGTLTNGISIYSSAGECYIMDAAGNTTLQSPHDENGEWVFYSKNTVTGKVLRVKMERLIRLLNKKCGGGFIEEE